jgi:hypothetical protein
MSRVINSNAPGKIRNHHRRTVAELLRQLSQRPAVDQEAKDMAAAVVFALQGIHQSVLQTIEAWEKRDYWTKADRFLREWDWANHLSQELSTVLREDDWPELPMVLARLMPHFIDIEIKKLTRPPSTWRGAYQELLDRDQNGRGAPGAAR